MVLTNSSDKSYHPPPCSCLPGPFAGAAVECSCVEKETGVCPWSCSVQALGF